MKITYLQSTYRAIATALTLVALWQCNIEVGNPDSNLPESMKSIQNLSFNLSAGGSCSVTAGTCTSVPVIFDDGHSSGITYEMTAVNFQLSALQLKPYAENTVWTQLDLLRGSSVVLSESTESAAVTAIALKFEPPQSSVGRTFEISGNLVMDVGGERVALPLKLVFDNQILAETAVSGAGNVIDGVEFDTSAWFDFSQAKGDFSRIFKALASGACRTSDAGSCTSYRETIARQVSRRISRSMTVKSHPAEKTSQQKSKSP